MKNIPKNFTNLAEDAKPVKKVNTGRNSQNNIRSKSKKSQRGKSTAKSLKRDKNRSSSNKSSKNKAEIDDNHYLVEEVEIPVAEGYKKSSLDIIAWNINGMRAMGKKKNLKELIRRKDPDIVCFYELKCDKYSYLSEDVKKEYNFMEIYPYKYFNFSQKSGYAGVAIYSKLKPLNYTFHLNDYEIDKESRFIKLEFNTFNFISVYVPTSGDHLKRLDFRIDKWDAVFKAYCSKLLKQKPLIIAGDMNVAHKEIDIHNPKVSL